MVMLFTCSLIQKGSSTLPHNNNATLTSMNKDVIFPVIIKQRMEVSYRCQSCMEVNSIACNIANSFAKWLFYYYLSSALQGVLRMQLPIYLFRCIDKRKKQLRTKQLFANKDVLVTTLHNHQEILSNNVHAQYTSPDLTQVDLCHQSCQHVPIKLFTTRHSLYISNLHDNLDDAFKRFKIV